MNLDEVLRTVNFISVKENKGKTYDIPRLNLELKNVTNSFVNKEVKEYEKTQKVSDVIGVLEVVMGGQYDPLRVDVNGFATIPVNYFRKSFMNYVDLSDADNLQDKNIEILSSGEWSERIASVVIDPAEYPYCTFWRNQTLNNSFKNGYIEFRPKSIDYVTFVYLRKPITPVYDFYVTSDDDAIYLPPGTVYTLGIDEESSSGDTGVAGVVTSQSVEIEFPESTHDEITNMLLNRVGVNLRDQELMQYIKLVQAEALANA